MRALYLDSIFDNISTHIPYNQDWANGTGYYDKATWLVVLKPGERAKSIDCHGRKLVFVGTRFGTCVFFERYKREERANEQILLARNMPTRLERFATAGQGLQYDEFSRLAGSDDVNIGHAVEDLFETQSKRFNTKDELYQEQVKAIGYIAFKQMFGSDIETELGSTWVHVSQVVARMFGDNVANDLSKLVVSLGTGCKWSVKRDEKLHYVVLTADTRRGVFNICVGLNDATPMNFKAPGYPIDRVLEEHGFAIHKSSDDGHEYHIPPQLVTWATKTIGGENVMIFAAPQQTQPQVVTTNI